MGALTRQSVQLSPNVMFRRNQVAQFLVVGSRNWLIKRPETLRLVVIGLPILLAGTWLGLRLYGRVDDGGFRKIVLALLLVSSAALILLLRPTDAIEWRPR
jgi:uncharacterized membrane protein YfcA